MKNVFIIIALAVALNAAGQPYVPFPDSNATWGTDLMTPIPFGEYHEYHFYTTNGDTLLNGKLYTIISQYPYSSDYCFIREDNKTVYCKYSSNTQSDTTEFVLYDFNVQLGDTVSLPNVVGGLNYYDAVVYSIDSVLIGTSFHRRIGLSGIFWGGQFIEGVGSAQGLLYPEIPWVDWWADLICFSKNDTIYSVNGSGSISPGDCYQIVGIDDHVTDNPDKLIYPNPATGLFFINYDKSAGYEVYNSMGQMVLTTSLPSVDLSNYPDGIYFIKIIDISLNKAIVRKIIKKSAL